MNRSRTDVTLESLWASGFAPHGVTSRGQRDFHTTTRPYPNEGRSSSASVSKSHRAGTWRPARRFGYADNLQHGKRHWSVEVLLSWSVTTL
jgi:hypothetical protein